MAKKKPKTSSRKTGGIDEPSSSPPRSPPLFPVPRKTDAIDELRTFIATHEPSSPARSSPRRKKDAFAQSPPDNHGVLLNPPDVDVPAPTAVPSPRQSSQRVEPAKDAITGNSNECGIGEEADDAYESDDSGDEDYRGDIYED